VPGNPASAGDALKTTRQKGHALKIGLYSITYLGVWYRGPALTLSEVIDRARKFGYDGVELDAKRPHFDPALVTKADCQELRRRAEDTGIEIYAVAANNDFSSPIPEHRETQLAYVRNLIERCGSVGTSTLRIFAAWPGVTTGVDGGRYDIAEGIWSDTHRNIDPEEIWGWCRDGLQECAQVAADAGVTLALQNHPEVVSSRESMLRMIRELDSPAVKACFDAPLGRKQGVTSMRQAVHEVGALQVLTHFGGEYEQDADGRIHGFVRSRNLRLHPEDFYEDFTLGMLDIGYKGFTGYELCHPFPKEDGLAPGIDFVDKNARLAAEYMRGIIARAKSAALVGGAEPQHRQAV